MRVAAIAAWAALCGVACARPASPLPARVVWAWDRDEDLRFLARDVGVAYLAGTITLDGSTVRVRRRHGALRLPAEVVRVPVVRVEAARPVLDDDQRARLVDALLAIVGDAPALQIDFEATASQRPFYRASLGALRSARPRAWISMTALGSWCDGDRWLAGLPVDEIVPMVYRLGPAAPALRRRLRDGRDLAPECRGSMGVITDEDVVRPARPLRVYGFSPRPWRAADWARLRAMLDGGAA